jgi:uncharacterized protein DUF2252
MAATTIAYPSVDERRAHGEEARTRTPPSAHSGWKPAADRPDPVALLEEQDADRMPGLVPVRHGRMMVSPFTFYRGAAARDATLASVTSYRQAMAEFAQMRTMDIWYAHLDEDQVMTTARGAIAGIQKEAKGAKKGARKQAKEREKQAKKAAKTAEKARAKAHTRDSLQALSKLGELVDGKYRIVSQWPIVIPARDLATLSGISPGDLDKVIRQQFQAYRATLREDQRRPLDRFQIVDMAHKVVGVGSVGNQAFIVLLQGRDANDPLFLQVKQATASVLERHLPKSRYRQHGQRVVVGQRIMQAASDIYLGWTRDPQDNRHYYWRQLRDMKSSADIESMNPLPLTFYARTCGWTLARAHARSGDPIAIAAYLGDGDAFDKAVTDFSERYAGQNEQDYQQFVKAIRSGRLEAREGV